MGERRIDPIFNVHENYREVNIINPYRFVGGGGDDLKSGLIACWEKNNTTGTTSADEHTNSYDGTLIGGVNVNQTGILDKAYLFDGTNDYVNYTDQTDFSFTDGSGNDQAFTWSLWINPSNVSVNKCLFAKYDGSNTEYMIIIRGSNSKILLRLYNTGPGAFIGRESSAALTVAHGWYHIVVTYDASEVYTGIKIYIDGVESSGISSLSGTYTGMSNTISALKMGVWNTTSSYAGLGDQFAMWNKVLTSGELSTLNNSNLGLPYSSW